MNRFEVIKTDKTFVMIKDDAGKIKHVAAQVTYAVSPEDTAPSFDYGSKEENDKEMHRFESGELLNICIKVTVSALGETGVDYLGMCFVTAQNMEADILNIASEYDMKNNAAIELVNNLRCTWGTLKPVFGE